MIRKAVIVFFSLLIASSFAHNWMESPVSRNLNDQNLNKPCESTTQGTVFYSDFRIGGDVSLNSLSFIAKKIVDSMLGYKGFLTIFRDGH